MLGWFIAAAVVMVVAALVWWSSGRARPDLRRRSLENSVAIEQARGGMHGGGRSPGGHTPSPGGHGF